MKLQELLKDLFEERQDSTNFNTQELSHNELELMKEALMKCDEFKEATELVILATPFVDNGKRPIKTDTIKIGDNVKFKNRVYLYNIMETPEMFDPKTLYVPVKNGACITPVQYDPITFMPHKQILLSVNVEQEMDRKATHDLLDDILDNPKEYRVKGMRGILVRGIFETIVNGETETDYDIGTINLDYNNPKYYSVTCLDNKVSGDSMTINIEMKFIPVELKEEFLEAMKLKDDFSKTFGTGLNNISPKDVDSFLNEHKKILL